ncbi:hypothetical protein ECP03052937_5327 [Escherichia coli p0305293.7]|nr:hypothetical protein ECP03052937_5327 [Escherichia coli p0305293.7]
MAKKSPQSGAQTDINVRFVHAGCGVNALSGLQKQYFQQVL